MKILISGSSGFVGGFLKEYLASKGHTIIPLKRGASWDPEKGIFDKSLLESIDAVINLTGENVAGRWTKAKKRAILESRVNSTKLLVDAINASSKPPQVLINASAIGYYGDRKNEVLTETSAPGDNFLADVCIKWEKEAEKAKIRTVTARFGVVLGNGGALKNMLTPFKLGLGGKMGSGKQYWSWIHVHDVVRVIEEIIESDVKGPVNTVAPEPITNEEFTKTMGRVLSRPTFFSMPEFAVKLVFGQMGEELFLASERVKPEVLQKMGFEWTFPTLEGALKNEV